MSPLLNFLGYDEEGRELFQNRKGEFFVCEERRGNELVLRKVNIPKDIFPKFFPAIIKNTGKSVSLYTFLGVYKTPHGTKEVYLEENGRFYSLVKSPIFEDEELLFPLEDSEKESIKRDMGYLAKYYGFI